MLLEINFTLVLFAVSFLIFIYLLDLTLYKPVGEIVELRKNLIANSYGTARQLTDEASKLLESYTKEIRAAKQFAHDMIQKTIQDAEKKKEEEISLLMVNLMKEKEIALKRIEEEQRTAIKRLENQLSELTRLITGKVLGMENALVGTH